VAGLRVIVSDIADRNITLYDKSLGIIRNGEDNIYPTRTERIINSSVTAKSAASMYGKFIMGAGFTVDMEDYTIGRTKNRKLTPNKLLQAIANEIKNHAACFIHVNYNANFKISTVAVIPYSYCRFGEEDNDNYSGKIVVYNNWDKRYSQKFDKTKFKSLDVFNSNPAVVKYQVEKAGGFDKYLGQIYYLTLDSSSTYPLSPIDVAMEDAESEYNFAVFRNRTIKKGFFISTILRHSPFKDDKEEEKFKEKIKEFQGAENAETIMMLEDEFTSDNKDGNLRIDKLAVDYNDKIFEFSTTTAANNIRKCYKNIPVVLIDYEQGKLGNTSGESFIAAQKFYNSMTEEERLSVEMAMKEIFSSYKENINPTGDWSIKELTLLKQEASISIDDILKIISAISENKISYDSGLSILKDLYGYDEEDAKKLLGQPKQLDNGGTVN
jgi:hypothetical protein